MGTKTEINKIPIKAIVKRLFAFELPSLCVKNAGITSAIGSNTNVPFVSFSVAGRNRQQAIMKKVLIPIFLLRYNAKIIAIEQIIVTDNIDEISSVPVITSPVIAVLN